LLIEAFDLCGGIGAQETQAQRGVEIRSVHAVGRRGNATVFSLRGRAGGRGTQAEVGFSGAQQERVAAATGEKFELRIGLTLIGFEAHWQLGVIGGGWSVGIGERRCGEAKRKRCRRDRAESEVHVSSQISLVPNRKSARAANMAEVRAR